ncbi:MAG: hypothetical protein GC150_06015 [Rhizobiales bacterium]|nr:hypothetical protein [Hyphomicrobiales bacterium]
MQFRMRPTVVRLSAAFVLMLVASVVAFSGGRETGPTFGEGHGGAGDFFAATGLWIAVLLVGRQLSGSFRSLLAVALVAVFGVLAIVAGIGACRLPLLSLEFLATALAGLSCLASAALGMRRIRALLSAAEA